MALASKCKLGGLLELPVTMHGLRPLVSVRINGTDTLFLTDSGAFYSMISPAAAAELKLRQQHGPSSLLVHGVGGNIRPDVAIVHNMTLAGVTFTKPWEFLVGGSEVGDGAAGILGQNILRAGDVEYDLAAGVIRLWKPEGDCGSTKLVYWLKEGQQYSLMDIAWATPRIPHTQGEAALNGARIHVVFDTGASVSVLTLRAAERAGIKPDSPGVVPGGTAGGIGRGVVQTWIAPFESFKVGEEEIRHSHLRIGDFDFGPDMDMVIGADFFLSHRVYVASSQHRLYFTYNGGPVFNLNTNSPADGGAAPPNAATATGAGITSASPAEPDDEGTGPTNAVAAGATTASNVPPTAPANPGAVPPTGEPTTAEGFSRRGAADAARGDFIHALADLGRACELDPNEPRYF
jgi:hypothetical protein